MAELKKDGIRAAMSESVERETLKGMGQRAVNPQETLEPKLKRELFWPCKKSVCDQCGNIGHPHCAAQIKTSDGTIVQCTRYCHEINTPRVRDSAAATVDYGALHWQSKSGAEETMCGRLAKDVRCTVLQDFATCETCKAVAFGYQMGHADERAASPVALRDEAAPTENGDAEDLHLAICQAVYLMNQGDLHTGHDFLRQTLVDYADKKAPLTRSQIVRRQQRSGSQEVSAIMVSSLAAAPSSPPPRELAQAAAEEWMNTHHASFETNQAREDALTEIILRTCFSEK